ncbi:MAG: hypothetical protein PHE86_05140 [Candidatus Marinimicrobia bacterium]|nr:hypothetical protein [Candidatus Neomarinimicrobiota bacterium]MDD5582294.1 hypothetical protein [Candidatus Neomarinimicrobiota bacterium]
MSISKATLESFCQEINKKHGISIAVCKIFGKRWSYLAGMGDDLYGGVKIRINDTYGVIANELPDAIKAEIQMRLTDLLLTS